MKDMINKVHYGECIRVLSKLPKEKVDLVLTDPPYNASNGGINLPNNKTGGAYYKVNEEWDKFETYEDYLEFTREWITEVDRVLKPKGSIMVCCSFHNLSEVILALKEKKYKFLNLITWKKTNPMPSITRRTLTYSTEFVVWFAKGSKWQFNYKDMKKYNQGKQLRDVWEFSICNGGERIKRKDGRAAHPTQKPLELFKRLIEMSSEKRQIVLDPFIGSGTTAIAAEELKRRWIGIDNNKEYIKLANLRIRKCGSLG